MDKAKIVGTIWAYTDTGSAFLITEFDQCQQIVKGLMSFEQSLWDATADEPEDDPVDERSMGLKVLEEYCEQIEVGTDGYQQALDGFAEIYRTKAQRLTEELAVVEKIQQTVANLIAGGE